MFLLLQGNLINPTQTKITITTGDKGGYCKGYNTITFTQCQDCGYIYNSTFDLNKISKEYQSEGYFSRKIVSKAMSNNIKTIQDKCLKYINKNSTCLDVAPGSGDMVNALIHNVKNLCIPLIHL
ncbi:hypothetical protein [Campylobacter jejuni]|uniref:hypothetical protein n=1 Tax=Campylobacter jejuni TaxID=197 RepID=UPI002043B5B1|nr:hypothetical protein [Campylobacter jejuni]